MKVFLVPIKLIEELANIAHATKDLALKGLIMNACKELSCANDYDYFVTLLGYMKRDYPNLIDYKKALTQVKRFQTKYNNI